MSDLLYWTARAGLVGAWLAVAVRAWTRRRAGPRRWLTCMAAAVVFASMRAWPWNYELLEAARAVLRHGGVYDERFWFKLLLACALVITVAAGARSLRRLASEPALLGCCVGLWLQAILLALETMSLDDLIPRCLVQQPGRYLVEGAFATVALLALRRRVEAG